MSDKKLSAEHLQIIEMCASTTFNERRLLGHIRAVEAERAAAISAMNICANNQNVLAAEKAQLERELAESRALVGKWEGQARTGWIAEAEAQAREAAVVEACLKAVEEEGDAVPVTYGTIEDIKKRLRALAPNGPALLEQQKEAWLKELYADPTHYLFGIPLADVLGVINGFEEANIKVNAKALEQVRKDARLEEHTICCENCMTTVDSDGVVTKEPCPRRRELEQPQEEK